jgi:CRISPR-associated protein Cmr1
MPEVMKIKIKTLSPIWTGGVAGICDRLHETGIIGSLRWWYEAIVRGLGGYACDPTIDERCELSGKERDEERRQKVCPVCYLFGCGGWKRRFQIHAEEVPTTPLHFRTPVDMNKSWLKRIFDGETQNIDNLKVFYGTGTFRIVLGGDDADYFYFQLIMLFKFISKYGGLGAKLQHGFGQIQMLEPEPGNDNRAIKKGLEELSRRIQVDEFFDGERLDTPYNLKNFISVDYNLPLSSLKSTFMQEEAHIGNRSKLQENRYIPCVLDLRYKGLGNFGMRRWLKEEKEWSESDEPTQLDQIDELLGPRSKWKADGTWKAIGDDLRTASRLCFGMPYKLDDGNYRLRIFGFAPPDILNADELKSLCEDYVNYSFNSELNPVSATFGSKITRSVRGDQE